MIEEVGFIAALAADPNDRTALLVFADWLEERDDPRAAPLRVLLEPEPDWDRIAELTSESNRVRDWVRASRCGCGSVVRLCNGAPFAGHAGQIVGTRANRDKISVTVRALFLGGLVEVEVDSSGIERIAPAE